MTQFVIDHHLLDSINFSGVFLGVLGFFYVTYEFFGRRQLKWFIRVITPGLIGALILFPAGVLEQAYSCAPRLIYTYSCAPLELMLRGGAVYALVGGMIGIFNGIFIDWPHSPKKPPLFSWKGCLIGLVIAFFIWFVSALVFGGLGHASAIGFPAIAFIEGGILAPTGGVAGGFWRFINWEPSPSSEKAYSSEKPPLFSWKGCLIGLISAFLFGFVSAFLVNIIPDTILVLRGDPRAGDYGIDLAKSLKGALTAAAFIGPAGAITGGISRFIFWRANELDDGKLGGIGAILTLFGFLIQLLLPLVSILDIPVR